MKILILKSVLNHLLQKDYTLSMNTSFADRFIGHLSDKKGVCTTCDRECMDCRSGYNIDFSESIAGVIRFPSTLSAIIDDPKIFLPKEVPVHDVLIPIAINEEILLAFLERFPISKGLIVPLEESNWISPYGKGSVTNFCKQRGIEVVFPKPFCAFDPEEGVLREFRRRFRIGKPELHIRLKEGIIEEVKVLSSAPCGATYFTARGLTGKSVDEDLVFSIDKLLSSYPCTAGSDLDREFQDSIIHQAVKIQRGILRSIEQYIPRHAMER